MIVNTLPTGQLEANCYIVIDEESREAMIIDPGDDPERILDALDDAEVRFIVLTHAHFDHSGAVPELKDETGALIVVHEQEMETYESVQDHAAFWGFDVPRLPQPDMLVSEGEKIILGLTEFTFIHTPGHTPGGMCIYTDGMVFTGDTLFMGSVGRTDLPGGNYAALRQSFRRLMTLPSGTKVYSGHGPMTTIGKEKVENMFAGEFL